MAELVWDKVGARGYESGLDRGVLYLPDGSAVVWNGLLSVVEKSTKENTVHHFDGRKISDLVVPGEFQATMKAVTYPREFEALEGLVPLRPGVYVGDQQPKTFGLSYRTKVSNDAEGDLGYKIHVLYNLTATPSDVTYAALSDQPSLIEFEWTLDAVPEEFEGFRPTAHIIIDTSEVDPWLIGEIEQKLYGSLSVEPLLISMPDLVAFMRDWYRVKIVDNGDGTWTATTLRDFYLIYLDGDNTIFQLVQVNAVYENATTYELSDTMDVSDVPEIKIEWFPDGTWSATTDGDGLIIMTSDTTFEILNANAEDLGDGSYRISDTTAET